MTIAAADAGPLIHLGEIGELSLLDLFGRLIVPDAVWHEAVQEGRLKAQQLEGFDNLIRYHVEPAAVAQFIRANHMDHLHAGESECLFICRRDGVPVLLTDDLAVRDAAASLGITPVGSLGVVVRAFHLGHLGLLEAEKCLLDLYRVSSLFVTRGLIDYVLDRIGNPGR